MMLATKIACPSWDAVGLVVMWTAFFYFSSATANIMNKQLVDEYQVSATILTFWHVCFAACIDGVMVKFASPPAHERPQKPESLTLWKTLLTYLPVSLFIVLGKFATYLSFGYVSMSLTHTAKASEPIFNVVLSALCFGEVRPISVNLSLIPIAFGVAFASLSELSYNHIGFFAAVTSAIAKVLQNIYTKRVMNTNHYTFFEVHLWCAIASIAILTPIMVYRFLTSVTFGFGAGVLGPVIVCSMVQYASSLSSYMLLSLVNHLSFTIINTMKRLVIISSGMFFFGNWDARNFLGVIIAVCGVFCYNIAKTKSTPPSVKDGYSSDDVQDDKEGAMFLSRDIAGQMNSEESDAGNPSARAPSEFDTLRKTAHSHTHVQEP